ncbi:MAG TPA: glycoside hydrolase family 15 protein [Sandaracinaceae bacterium LLY-WYZ-13_1]|nr:glycoside hydrolase family 15 protein [Sandaracinaceae bacterium LLY-WYZ-13_1]
MTQPPISDYAIVGDCHSAALVSREGAIDWLCWPRFDAGSWFARILDWERGGALRIRPVGDFETERRYLPGSNVLRTTFHAEGGCVELDDMMTVAAYEEAHATLRSDRELLRIARCTEGEVELAIDVTPRPDYARARPKLERRGALGVFCTHGADAMVLRVHPGTLGIDEDGGRVHGRWTLRAGETAQLGATFAREEPAIVPALGEAAQRRAAQTERWWRSWSSQCRYAGRYQDAVKRSMLALRLMQYAPTGGLVAAPTTSLPERVGGERNWDYRYCWLRDAALTVQSLLGLGYEDEASSFIHWMLHTTRLTWPEIHTLYDLHGHRDTPEAELPHLAGYRGSRPVRIGNGASDQLQLDSYGELVCAATAYWMGQEDDPSRETWRQLRKVGEWVCAHWCDRDEGIWEIRAERQPHTYSVVMCWAALDGLLRLADRFDLRCPRERFRETRARIREAVETHGWSEAEQSYQATFEEDRADASLLLLGRFGYADPHSARMRGTVARVRRDLERDGLVWRYPPSTDDGVAGHEAAFGVCSFWLVGALARQGELGEARRCFERLLEVANDVGLYAEEMRAEDGAPRGNFPQALTHLGLVDAALELERCERAVPRDGAEAVA